MLKYSVCILMSSQRYEYDVIIFSFSFKTPPIDNFCIHHWSRCPVAHLICYVRFVDFSLHSLVEELLFCKPIEVGCRGIDLFNIIDNFISTNKLDWENCISTCTDGARAMSGSRSGLRNLIQERAPMAKKVHCMIHREALVARELCPELGATVEIITKVINFIKTRPLKSRMFEKLCAEMNAEHRSLLFYCSSRWLSLGKSFERV